MSSDPRRSGRPRVVVLGAGITGLAAAHRIHTDAPEIDVVVLDAAARPGGKILTGEFDGLTLDAAADAFLARVPEGRALCEELGLADDLVSPATTSAFVWSHGQLRRLPAGLVLGVPTDLDALRTSGIVSDEGVERAALDLELADNRPTVPDPDDPSGRDESVGSLVRRRLGDEVADQLVAPLLGGVNAGDADRLSLAAGAPQLAAAVADSTSLIAGLRAQAERARPDAAGDRDDPPPVFLGLPGGTGRLVDALVASLPAGSVRLGLAAHELTPVAGGGFVVTARHTNGADGDVEVHADAVICALASFALAPLVDSLPGGDLDGVVDELDRLAWASVVMAAFAVPSEAIEHRLDGSGYLVPAPDRRFVTACSFASSKWAHLGRPGRAILRVSAGHDGDGGAAVALDDASIVDEMVADLGEHLGLHDAPDAVRLTRWERGLPQYRPGHLERAERSQQLVWATHPGVWPTGASFAGLGLPACIRQGSAAAHRVLDHLLPHRAPVEQQT